MGMMKKCPICGKSSESFKQCDKCMKTGCVQCMSRGNGGETTCAQCKQGKARPV